MSDLDGRMGGLTAGYDIKAKWDGERLRGRIGGRFGGKDIDLTLRGGEVDGRIGGVFGGFDAHGAVDGQRVEVRLGGHIEGDNVELKVSANRITGRFSGRIDGKDVELRRDGPSAARTHRRTAGRQGRGGAVWPDSAGAGGPGGGVRLQGTGRRAERRSGQRQLFLNP